MVTIISKHERILNKFEPFVGEIAKNVRALTNKGSALGALGRYNESLIYYNKFIKSASTIYVTLHI